MSGRLLASTSSEKLKLCGDAQTSGEIQRKISWTWCQAIHSRYYFPSIKYHDMQYITTREATAGMRYEVFIASY